MTHTGEDTTMVLESLPERPISSNEYEQITESESVVEGFRFAEHGGSGGEYILQFALDLEDEYVGLHFDPVAEQWELAGRAATFEEISTALSDVRND